MAEDDRIERKPFNIKLSKAEREALEAHRYRLHAKSEADALRMLIMGERNRDTSAIPQAVFDLKHGVYPRRGPGVDWEESPPDDDNGVQFGPTPVKAGERLKKGKAK